MTASHPRLAAGTPVPAALPGEPAPVGLPGTASPSSPAHLRGGGEAQTPGTQGGGEPTRVPGQLVPGMAKLAAAMTEADLERKVRAIAADLGLLLFHAYDSRRSPPGFPDLVIVGRRVMYRELKKENGRVMQAQKTWLAALRDAEQDAGVWRPSGLIRGDVARELAALAGIGAR